MIHAVFNQMVERWRVVLISLILGRLRAGVAQLVEQLIRNQ